MQEIKICERQVEESRQGEAAKTAASQQTMVRFPGEGQKGPEGRPFTSSVDLQERDWAFIVADRPSSFDIMRIFRRHRFLVSFLAVLVFSSVMVVLQYRRNQARHTEVREAFIFLYTKGYRKQADALYKHLLKDVTTLSDSALEDDFQRTMLLVDPTANQPENMIWNYHWTMSVEIEKRSPTMLRRALELAGAEH